MSEFDTKATGWDDHAKVARAVAVAEAIGEQVPLADVGDLFEFGCGTGLLSLALHPRPARALLTDTSEGMLDVVRGKIAAENLAGWEASPLDLTTTDGPEHAFDLVVSLLALHHVHDVPALLARFRRLLRPGGWLAISDLDDDDGQFHDTHTHRHHDGFDRATLARWLADAGFHDVEFATPHLLTKVVEGVERDFPLFLAVGRMAPVWSPTPARPPWP
ncbi:MAG: class I SAM-dependent DNA methyltransferase [Actinomycetota bacterium]